MFKKFMVITLAAALTVFMAGTAFALLGPHASLHTDGDCVACHNNSATPSLRGWTPSADAPGGLPWWGRPIGGLCGGCHSGGTYGTAMLANNMTAYAAATTAHSFTVANGPKAPSSANNGGAINEAYHGKDLPYAGVSAAATSIDCTTCHNVHNADKRPFSMVGSGNDFSGLCKTCHAGRANSTLFKTANTYTITAAYSTHPTDLPIEDWTTAPSGTAGFETGNIALELSRPVGAAWSLGGKRTDGTATGNFSCQTCHAVHLDQTTALASIEDLLAIYNAGQRPSALCKGCHTGGDLTESVGAGGTSDHPVDAITGQAFYPDVASFWATGIPSDWVGNNHFDTGATGFEEATGQTPACSSCHDAHGGLPNTSLQYGPIPGYVVTNLDSEWCYSCHYGAGFAPDYHHSCDVNYAASVIGCGDCHGAGTTWSAHNGFWTFRTTISATDSALCEICHTATDPVTLIGYAGATWPAHHGPVIGDLGTASHSVNANNAVDNVVRSTTYNWVTSFSTYDYPGTPAGAFSQFGTGSPVAVICESCHNILENVGPLATSNSSATGGYEMNLLLGAYEDDTVGSGLGEAPNADGVSTGDAFCRVCHNDSGATTPVTYVHAPGAHTIISFDYLNANHAGTTNPVTPYDRATSTVLTVYASGSCPNTSTADASGAPGDMSYPTDNQVNCDSCHRPHNGWTDTTSGVTGSVIVQSATATVGAKAEPCLECHSIDIMCGY